MTEKNYLTISQVSTGIQRAIAGAFPRSVWVVGEIQGLDRSRHRGHWYFELCETNADGSTFRLGATIWKGVQKKLFGPGGRCAGVFEPDAPMDGTKILALCKVDFYPPYGKVSLHLQDIDPEYTLGELEARRKALLERLQKEDLLERNAQRPLEEVPLRIGLITSVESAAYNDFIKELSDSGYGFRVIACDARMQGDESLTTVPAAFRTLEALSPDLIALVRGGGSRLDLSWFDREEIVFSIVHCSVPVVTGIGHEIDVSLGQMVASEGKKTPTAAAAFVTGRVARYLERIIETGDTLARAAARYTEREEEALSRGADRIRLGCRAAVSDATGFLQSAGQRLSSSLLRRVAIETERLGFSVNKLVAGRHIARLATMTLELERRRERLGRTAIRAIESSHQHLALLREKGRLLDPGNVIKRGFALVRAKTGTIVKEVAGLKRGDPLTVHLRDGKLQTEIKEINQEVPHGQEEGHQLEIW